jgi:hypothetical protein
MFSTAWYQMHEEKLLVKRAQRWRSGCVYGLRTEENKRTRDPHVWEQKGTLVEVVEEQQFNGTIRVES